MAGNRALFDIKVALLGPVSSGKTTVLNALLGDYYGDVQNSPPGSGAVHHYRLVSPPTATTTSSDGGLQDIPNPESLEESDASYSYYPRSNITSVVAPANTTNQQNWLIQAASSPGFGGRTIGSGVKEIYHNVPLEQELFDMRPDTQLVLVDIPGLEFSPDVSNVEEVEQQQDCLYKNYVQEHWNSFDVLLVVLDVTAASNNCAQQEHLLRFIHSNLDRQNRLPVLCLWNKLDDPYDPVHLDIIQQTQHLVNLILNPEPSSHYGERNNNANRNNNNGTVPFRIYCSSEPYTFGPPMTEDKIIPPISIPKFTATQTPRPKDDTSDMSDNNNNNNNHNDYYMYNTPTTVKEPGEGYVVVTKREAEEDIITAQQKNNKDSPLSFLPLSAKIALVYKRVSHLSLEEFSPWMEEDFMVERLGRELIGLRRWNRLTLRQDQVAETYHILQDPDEYNRALDTCGYTSFQNALAELVGNRHGAQTAILEAQMESSLEALLAVGKNDTTKTRTAAFDNYSNEMPLPTLLLAPQMYSVYTKFRVLYGATEASATLPNELQSAFWANYEKMEMAALQAVLEGGPTNVRALAEPLEQLRSFYSLSKVLNWQDGRSVVTRKMKHLVLQYFQLLLEQESTYDYSAWGAIFQSTRKRREETMATLTPWSCLSPKDWIQIWSSILLLSYDRRFCQTFGREKLLLEELLEKARSSWKDCSNMALRICPYCGDDLRPFQNEWICKPCGFAFFTCYPSTVCNSCNKYRFDEPTAEKGYNYSYAEPHVCPMNGITYSIQQDLHFWMRTFYNRSQELLPDYPAVYNQVVQTGNIPESLLNPNHLGHVVHQYCNLRERIENDE